MKITICIDSSCHLKGSRRVVEQLQCLIAENDLKETIELGGAFCMGNCQNGVCVTLNEKAFYLTPEMTRDFFQKEVLSQV
jgi:NADH:ubiquinone oxidoreductase subunit E